MGAFCNIQRNRDRDRAYIIQLESQVTRLQENEQVQNQLNDEKNKYSELQQEQEKLKQQMDSLNSKIINLDQILEGKKEQITILEGEKNKMIKDIKQVKDEVQQQKQQYLEQKEALQAKINQIEQNNQRQLQQKNHEIDNEKQQNQSLQTEIYIKQEQIEQEKNEKLEFQKQVLQIQNQLKQKENELQEMENNLNILQIEIIQKEQELKQQEDLLHAQLQLQEQLNKQNASLRNQISQQQALIEQRFANSFNLQQNNSITTGLIQTQDPKTRLQRFGIQSLQDSKLMNLQNLDTLNQFVSQNDPQFASPYAPRVKNKIIISVKLFNKLKNQYYKHKKCQNIAYIRADGIVNCQFQSCKQYEVHEIWFNDVNNEVEGFQDVNIRNDQYLNLQKVTRQQFQQILESSMNAEKLDQESRNIFTQGIKSTIPYMLLQ